MTTRPSEDGRASSGTASILTLPPLEKRTDFIASALQSGATG
jgi:hypothetical protein